MLHALNQRDLAALETMDQPFRDRLLRCFYAVNRRIAGHADIYAVIRDGWRDAKEQFEHYKKGRKLIEGKWVVVDKKAVTTNAKAHLSAHCYRLAGHVVLIDNKDTPATRDDTWLHDLDGRWDFIGEEAAKLGLEWGGNWSDPVDKAHLEWKDWKQFAKSRNYKPLDASERVTHVMGLGSV